jgi:hypothetical protein
MARDRESERSNEVQAVGIFVSVPDRGDPNSTSPKCRLLNNKLLEHTAIDARSNSLATERENLAFLFHSYPQFCSGHMT